MRVSISCRERSGETPEGAPAPTAAPDDEPERRDVKRTKATKAAAMKAPDRRVRSKENEGGKENISIQSLSFRRQETPLSGPGPLRTFHRGAKIFGSLDRVPHFPATAGAEMN